ncbi:IS21 family transposase [Herbaspirillum rubrisubalbicans]|uniref:IS21 family transposase n=1 Tax=Herbaspirillum rubrisubalbicans TaxID=80842 RepID=UPI0015593582
MRTIRDVLRYKFDKNFSQRKIESTTGLSRRSISRILVRFQDLKLSWPLPADIDDERLDALIFPPPISRTNQVGIDFENIEQELRGKGATLAALYEEWQGLDPKARTLSYSAFTRRYARWKKSSKLAMLNIEKYGQAAYIDYSGMLLPIHVAPNEIRQAQIFVGVLGGSRYVFAEAAWTQRSMDWIASHVRMFAFFGGVPETLVPDNLKSAVNKADRYEPVINESYKQLCRYYNTVPEPARPRKPKDKAPGEGGVLWVQRHVLFPLRKQIFTSLEEANRAIRVLVEKFNQKPFQKKSGSRTSHWLSYELPALLPLPPIPYEVAEWGKVRAGPDYHVRIEGSRYSVPHQKRGLEFDYRMTPTAIELLQFGRVITSHPRLMEEGGIHTHREHLAPAHDAVQMWTKDTAMKWASEIGGNTAAQLLLLIERARGRVSGYRTMQAMKNLAKNFGASRLEDACGYASNHGITGTDKLRSILQKNLDQIFKQEPDTLPDPVDHENIRGPEYYQNADQDKKGESK